MQIELLVVHRKYFLCFVLQILKSGSFGRLNTKIFIGKIVDWSVDNKFQSGAKKCTKTDLTAF